MRYVSKEKHSCLWGHDRVKADAGSTVLFNMWFGSLDDGMLKMVENSKLYTDASHCGAVTVAVRSNPPPEALIKEDIYQRVIFHPRTPKVSTRC